MKKILWSIAMIGMASIVMFQATSAAFEETVTVAGASFTVGTDSSSGGGGTGDTNTSLKLLSDLSGGSIDSNLSDAMSGPDFDNITSEWSDQISLKVHNKGTVDLNLISSADYISDPDTLRDDIYVEIVDWSDSDNDGVVDEGELGASYGYDTILRLKNDTFALGSITADETRGFVMIFDGTGVTDTNFGQNAVYDFAITGVDVVE